MLLKPDFGSQEQSFRYEESIESSQVVYLSPITALTF